MKSFIYIVAPLLALTISTTSITAEPFAPGTGVSTQLSPEEQVQIEETIKSKHPEFVFESLSIEKFAAPSRAQGGHYYNWKARLKAIKDEQLSAFVIKAGDSVSVSGLYDVTIAPNATITDVVPNVR